MSDTAFRDAFDMPDEDDSEQDILGTPAHDEFISEIGQTLEMPNLDVDGYVGPDGHMLPHQSPSEVEEQRDVTLEVDAHMHGIPDALPGDDQKVANELEDQAL